MLRKRTESCVPNRFGWTCFCYRRRVEVRQFVHPSLQLMNAVSGQVFPFSASPPASPAGCKSHLIRCLKAPNWVHCLKLPRLKTRRAHSIPVQGNHDWGEHPAHPYGCDGRAAFWPLPATLSLSPSLFGVPRRERTLDRKRYNWSRRDPCCSCTVPAFAPLPRFPSATQEHYDEMNRAENTSCGSYRARLGQPDDPQVTTFRASHEQ